MGKKKEKESGICSPYARVYLEWITPITEGVPDKSERCDIYENIFARFIKNQTNADVPFNVPQLSGVSLLVFDILRVSIDQLSKKYAPADTYADARTHNVPADVPADTCEQVRDAQFNSIQFNTIQIESSGNTRTHEECKNLSLYEIGLILLQNGYKIDGEKLRKSEGLIFGADYPIKYAMGIFEKINTYEAGNFIADFVGTMGVRSMDALEIYGYTSTAKTCTLYGSKWARVCYCGTEAQEIEPRKAAFAEKYGFKRIVIKAVEG